MDDAFPTVTYFLIMPAWLLVELALAVLWVASRGDKERVLWNLYVRWVLIGSSVGFVLANLAFATSAEWASEALTGPHLKVVVGAWLLLGPVVCSAAGFTGGTLAGLLRASRLARRGWDSWDDHHAA